MMLWLEGEIDLPIDGHISKVFVPQDENGGIRQIWWDDITG